MEKFITREEFLKEEFKKAHERVDFELINVTKALYQKGCFISGFYGIDKFRTCEECNCIRNKEIVFGEFGITKPTDENKEKCYQEFCSKKKDKILEEVAERFHTLKAKTFEVWSKDTKVLDYYFNHTPSGKYLKHKEYYKKKADKLLKQLEEVKISFSPICEFYGKPFDWSTKIVFTNCKGCSKPNDKWNREEKRMMPQTKEECFNSKRADRTRELANEINTCNREVNITFEQWIREESIREAQRKAENNLFYNEMKSLGCLHNCGLED